MTEKKKPKGRGSLGLAQFKPKSTRASDAEIKTADAVAKKRGFTSREAGEETEQAAPKVGRPRSLKQRRQLNLSVDADDLEWYKETRDEMGVNGAKLFSLMRQAFERGAK